MNKKDVHSAFALRKAKETAKIEPVVTESPMKLAFEERFGKEKLNNWKKQHGNRELIFLGVGNDKAVLRPPTADDLSDYMTTIGTASMSKAVVMIMEALWLDGDFSLIDDEDKFISIFLQINNILEGRKAEFFRY